jgi:hypothetical protein
LSWLPTTSLPIAWLHSVRRLWKFAHHVDGFGQEFAELISHCCDSRGIRGINPIVEERKIPTKPTDRSEALDRAPVPLGEGGALGMGEE